MKINQLMNAMFAGECVRVRYTDTQSSKSYTYKSPYPKGTVKEGNKIVVFTPSKEYKVLTVLEVLPASALSLDVEFSYKFFIAILDETEHNAAVLREQLLADKLQEKQRETLVNRLMAELGVDLTAIEAPQS